MPLTVESSWDELLGIPPKVNGNGKKKKPLTVESSWDELLGITPQEEPKTEQVQPEPAKPLTVESSWDELLGISPEKPTPAPPGMTPEMQAQPPQSQLPYKEEGRFKEYAKTFGGAMLGTATAPFHLTKFAGRMFDSKGLQNWAEERIKFAREIAPKTKPHGFKEFKAGGYKDIDFYVNNVLEFLPSTFVAGGAGKIAGKALMMIGKSSPEFLKATQAAYKILEEYSKGKPIAQEIIKDAVKTVNKFATIIGTGTTIGMEAGGQAEQVSEDIKRGMKVSKLQDALAVIGGGTIAGILEELPIAHLMKKLDPTQNSKKLAGKLLKRILSIPIGSVEEGSTEGLQQIVENAALKLGYKPDQKWSEGVADAIIKGMGGGVGLGTLSALRSEENKSNSEATADARTSDFLRTQPGIEPTDVGTQTTSIPDVTDADLQAAGIETDNQVEGRILENKYQEEAQSMREQGYSDEEIHNNLQQMDEDNLTQFADIVDNEKAFNDENEANGIRNDAKGKQAGELRSMAEELRSTAKEVSHPVEKQKIELMAEYVEQKLRNVPTEYDLHKIKLKVQDVLEKTKSTEDYLRQREADIQRIRESKAQVPDVTGEQLTTAGIPETEQTLPAEQESVTEEELTRAADEHISQLEAIPEGQRTQEQMSRLSSLKYYRNNPEELANMYGVKVAEEQGGYQIGKEKKEIPEITAPRLKAKSLDEMIKKAKEILPTEIESPLLQGEKIHTDELLQHLESPARGPRNAKDLQHRLSLIPKGIELLKNPNAKITKTKEDKNFNYYQVMGRYEGNKYFNVIIKEKKSNGKKWYSIFRINDIKARPLTRTGAGARSRPVSTAVPSTEPDTLSIQNPAEKVKGNLQENAADAVDKLMAFYKKQNSKIIYRRFGNAHTLLDEIEEDVKNGMSREEAERNAYEAIKAGDKKGQVQDFNVFGRNFQEFQDNISRRVVEIFKGADITTVIEETAETYYKQRAERDKAFRYNIREWRKQYEKNTGEKSKQSDIEWFSDRAIDFALWKQIHKYAGLRGSIRGILGKFREYAKAIIGRAWRFSRYVQKGKVSKELTEELRRATMEPIETKETRAGPEGKKFQIEKKHAVSMRINDIEKELDDLSDLSRTRRLTHSEIDRQDELRKSLLTDTLTGLPNQPKTQEYIEEVAKKGKKYIAMMDIDNFKAVNEIYGHDGGNVILKNLGKLLRDKFGNNAEFIGRWGGEELAMVFPKMDNTTIDKISSFIKNISKELHTTDNQPVTLSMGVSKGVSSIKTGSKADDLLMDAKESGKNRVHILLDKPNKIEYIKGSEIGGKKYVRRFYAIQRRRYEDKISQVGKETGLSEEQQVYRPGNASTAKGAVQGRTPKGAVQGITPAPVAETQRRERREPTGFQLSKRRVNKQFLTGLINTLSKKTSLFPPAVEKIPAYFKRIGVEQDLLDQHGVEDWIEQNQKDGRINKTALINHLKTLRETEGTTYQLEKRREREFNWVDKEYLNLPKEDINQIHHRLKVLGLETYKVKTFKDMRKAAASLGLTPEDLIKVVRKRGLTDVTSTRLRDDVKTAQENLDKIYKQLDDLREKSPEKFGTEKGRKDAPEIQVLKNEINKNVNRIENALRTITEGGTELGRAMVALRLGARRVDYKKIQELNEEIKKEEAIIANIKKNNKQIEQKIKQIEQGISKAVQQYDKEQLRLEQKKNKEIKQKNEQKIKQRQAYIDMIAKERGRIHQRLYEYWGRQAIRRLGDKEFTPEMEMALRDLIHKGDKQRLSLFVAGLYNATMAEKMITLWKAGLLTSPTTHFANIFGNATMSGLKNMTDLVAAPLDIMISLITGKRTSVFSPRGIYAKIKSIPQSLREGKKFFKTGLYSQDILTKYDIQKTIKFNNILLQKYTDAIFRSLGGEDIVFRRLAMQEALVQQAELIALNEMKRGELNPANKKERISNLLQNPTNEMIVNSIDAADYATFQEDNSLAEIITGWKAKLAKKGFTGDLGKSAIDVIVPFTKTPTNIAKRIVEHSPAGLVKALIKLAHPSTRSQEAFVRDFSRGITGTGVIALGAYLALKGLMTGNPPEKEKEREDWYAEGKQPNSILIGGKWRSLNRISPIGNLLSIGASLQQLYEKDNRGMDLLISGSYAGIKQVKEQSMLMGISGLMRASEYPTAGAKLIHRTISSVIPSFISRTARTFHPEIKDPARYQGFTKSIMQNLQARIPYFARTLPARLDVFGKPIITAGGRLNLFDPFSSKEAVEHPILEELKRVNKNTDDKVHIGTPGRKWKGKNLTNIEYYQYHGRIGALTEQTLNMIINSPEYKKLSYPYRALVLKYYINDVRHVVQKDMFKDKSDPELEKKQKQGEKILRRIWSRQRRMKDISKISGIPVEKYKTKSKWHPPGMPRRPHRPRRPRRPF